MEFGQAANRVWASKAGLAAEDVRGHLPGAGELACAAGKDDAVAGVAVEPGIAQAVADHFEGLLQAGADNLDHLAAGDFLDVVLGLADERDGQHLALVVRAALGVAVEGFQPLGVGDGGGEQAGDVVGDVDAAERDLRGVDDVALAEDGDVGRAAAHVDDGRAEFAFVVDQDGQAGGHGGADEVGDVELAPFDGDDEVAQRRRPGVYGVQADGELVAVQAAGVSDAVGVVDGEAEREDVDGVAAFVDGAVAAFVQDAAEILVADRAVAHRPLQVDLAADGRAAGEVDDDAAQVVLGHLLGGANGLEDGEAGLLDVGYATAADAAGGGKAETGDAEPGILVDAADETANLAAAHVEHAERAGAERFAASGRGVGRHSGRQGGAGRLRRRGGEWADDGVHAMSLRSAAWAG